MIIKCEQCGSTYYVDRGLLANYYKRKVKCVNCGHVWLWENQESPQDALVSPPAFADDMFAPPQYQHLAPVRWPFYMVTFLVGLIAMLILGHRYVRHYVPITRPIYDLILPRGLPLHEFLLSNLRVEYAQHSMANSITPEVKITGTLTYKPEENIARTPPSVEVTFYERGTCPQKSWLGKILEKENSHMGLCPTETWMIQPYNQLMMPGEQVPFEFSSAYKGSKKPDMMDARVVIP